jgi:hypothetical protein
LAGRKIKGETRKKYYTGINKKMMKKIVKGTSEPSVPQTTGDKQPIIHELTVLNDKK